ncbi:MAG TPA: hypothetical protein VGP24_02235, partial [Glaciihabitans sp.]|nr:hypothetical protein [Glaciihabitans sp.]
MIAAIAAVLAFAVAPGTASAAFDISSFSVTPSTTQSGANPTLDVSLQRSGSQSEDLRDFAIHFPNGLQLAAAATSQKCSALQFQRDNCPAGSRVGQASFGGTVSLGSFQIFSGAAPGSIYALDNQTLGIVVR